jgi:hypothetical protein
MVAAASPQSPGELLARARAAKGDPATLQEVTSLRVRGSQRRTLGTFAADSSWTLAWQFPDKFLIEEVRHTSMGPMGSVSTTRRSGFNGDRPISYTISDMPRPPLPPSPLSDAERVLRQKHELARLSLAMLASPQTLSSIYPLIEVAAGDSLLGAPSPTAVTLAGPDGHQLRMEIDPQTGLPAAMVWMGRPIVSITTTSTAIVSSRGEIRQPPAPVRVPVGDPTAGMPDVEYRLTLSDYKVDKGIHWPRRLTITMDGKPYEQVRVSRYEVNPKINPKTFEVR